MKSLFDKVSIACSRLSTKTYSTSFSLGILFIHRKLRNPIYSIYAFVRLADEIVDSFQGYAQKDLLQSFRQQADEAIRDRISLNPILNSFQEAVHLYSIDRQWIDAFLDSMEMDLIQRKYDDEKFRQYIFGSAEVVGLMCLHVFTEGDRALFEKLKPYAMRLGAAFQKVNFLRDAKADSVNLGRIYFPDIDLSNFSEFEKERIELAITDDFAQALEGIKMLPESSRNGVYLSYYYYYRLFRKIKKLPAKKILSQRIRIANTQKLFLMFKCNLRYKLNMM